MRKKLGLQEVNWTSFLLNRAMFWIFWLSYQILSSKKKISGQRTGVIIRSKWSEIFKYFTSVMQRKFLSVMKIPIMSMRKEKWDSCVIRRKYSPKIFIQELLMISNRWNNNKEIWMIWGQKLMRILILSVNKKKVLKSIRHRRNLKYC